MIKKLLLDSLEIKNYRVFEHLRIEHLGRVNLVVGKNNVGKSSLLEALLLYANEGSLMTFWRILEARDEGRRPLPTSIGERKSPDEWVSTIKQLFHRDKTSLLPDAVEIGPIRPTNKTLSAQQILYTTQIQEDGRRRLLPFESNGSDLPDDIQPALRVRFGEQESIYRYGSVLGRQQTEATHSVFVSANGLDPIEIGQLWDNISLTDLEEDVLTGLRIIAPQVERLNLVSASSRAVSRGRDRIPIVKSSSFNEPIPLRSLGDGMNRLFGVLLALVNARNDFCFIDEIESGLHYSVQPNVWRLVFEVAQRLNIQVFATTHSWDCLTAFQEAARAYDQEEGVLIRLVEKQGRIFADLFDEEDLTIVAREGIEVR